MRIFLSGDKDLANWHLPVAKSLLTSFAKQCESAGIKQKRFTHYFEETKTTVYGQYTFGELSLQIHSPEVKVTQVKPKDTEELFEPKPRTFYIETSQGFFWVIVGRDKDGKPVVNLQKFVAIEPGTEFAPVYIYPGIGQRTQAMVAGFIDKIRYVITQKACLMFGEKEKKGTIKLPQSMDAGRINISDKNEYVIMSGKVANRSIKRVSISTKDNGTELVLDIKHFEFSSSLSAESGELVTDNLQPTPTWLHRKCTGSYFSPQKTIGFHIDLGTDDNFLGNLNSIGSGLQDKLVPEFNHSAELYEFLDILQFPIVVSNESIAFISVSPTMYFRLSNPDDKCWGGYHWDYGAGCADYQSDFGAWMLSPRPIKVTINLNSGEKSIVDLSGKLCLDSVYFEYNVKSVDGKFNSRFVYDRKIKCDTNRFNDPVESERDKCDWEVDGVGHCGNYEDPTGYTMTSVMERRINQNLVDYGRENLDNTRLLYFVFGGNAETKETERVKGFYFLFEGRWHLDVGVMWTRDGNVGNNCGLCSMPQASQVPGGLIWFMLIGWNQEYVDWVTGHGHEYVKNLEITIPLGVYGNIFGFQAKVPEHFAAPHDPEVLVGGIEYAAQDVEGGFVQCERALMSTPCECDGNILAWRNDGLFTSSLNMGGGMLAVIGGCPPYNWKVRGGKLFVGTKDYGSQERNTTINAFTIAVDSEACDVEVIVTDACDRNVEMEDRSGTTGVVYGPDLLYEGSTGSFSSSFGATCTVSTGLSIVSSSNGTYVLMASSPGAHVITFHGPCGATASKTLVVADIDEPCTNVCQENHCGVNVVGAIVCCYGRWARLGGTFSGYNNLCRDSCDFWHVSVRYGWWVNCPANGTAPTYLWSYI